MNLSSIVDEITQDIAANARAIEQAADAKEEGLTPGKFGIAIATVDGAIVRGGEAECRFPIQSISKVFALALALRLLDEKVFERVGREPSGDPFNSVIDLERTHGIPRNPFINAGALVVVDLLAERIGTGARDAVIDLVREQSERDDIPLNEAVLNEGSDLNRAMFSFMQHHGNVRAEIEAVMEAYARQCAIELDCIGLARAGRFMARTRLDPDDADARARAARMRKIQALMMTCGHYDGSGDFAVRVGLPAKSGVGGGILAIAPEVASIAVWSPNLDQNGNSILGVHALELLNNRTGWSVFGPPLA